MAAVVEPWTSLSCTRLRTARNHQPVFAFLNNLAALVDEFRGQHDDPPARFALRQAHAADTKFDVNGVADLDRAREVPGPAQRHPGQKAIVALRLQAVGERKAKKTV